MATIQSNKRMPIILLFVLGAVGLILGFLGLQNDRMDPAAARNGIVWVRTGWVEDNKQWSGSGTGWAVGKPGEPVQYIVTNGHVIEKAHTAPADAQATLRVFFSGAENDSTSVQVVFYSPPEENDLAILKLPTKTQKRRALILRDSDSVAIGEAAVALGYPSLSSAGQQIPTFDIDDVSVTRGIISKRVVPASASFDAFQMDVPVLKGNSGGPLVDSNGHVIGVNTLSYEEMGMTYAIEINELIKVLAAERIEYTMARTGFAWLPTWTGYVFLPLGILSLLTAVFLIVKSRRTLEPVLEPLPPGRNDPKSTPHGPVVKKAVLMGVTGPFAGQSFDLSQDKLTMGRDPASCNIIFDEKTPGISRRHCQVLYDPSEESFLIRDLGSSYGTYLGNGKKLPANVPEKLSAGDTFYLNNSSYRFLVTKA